MSNTGPVGTRERPRRFKAPKDDMAIEAICEELNKEGFYEFYEIASSEDEGKTWEEDAWAPSITAAKKWIKEETERCKRVHGEIAKHGGQRRTMAIVVSGNLTDESIEKTMRQVKKERDNFASDAVKTEEFKAPMFRVTRVSVGVERALV